MALFAVSRNTNKICPSAMIDQVAVVQRSAALFSIRIWKQKFCLTCLLVTAQFVAGCTTIQSLEPGASHDRYYFGIIRIQENGNGSPDIPQVQRISGVGVQFDNAVSVGYFSRVQISMPKDCRLIVIIRGDIADEEQQEFLTKLGGSGLCTTELAD